ncbi:HEAT repeat domain-containing protein, partial [Nostoc sp. NMS9]|uniref:HEAT repeat domain-containing protein n=1 Tax=Nostoc sp. NMS9 TaxID=2815393 RepID=UPI0025DC79D6
IGNAEAVPELIAALKDSDYEVRRNAVSALAKIDNAEAVRGLIAALKNSDSDVRYYVASALGNIGNAEALNKIIGLSEIDIYEAEIFTSARTLAVRFSKQKLSFIPVYPELVRFNPILTFVKRRLRF